MTELVAMRLAMTTLWLEQLLELGITRASSLAMTELEAA